MEFIIEDVIYVIYNIIRICIICQFAKLFLKELKISIQKKTFLLILYIFINSIVYFIVDSPNINLLVNFIMFIIYTYAYKSTTFMRLFSFFIIYILNMAYEGGLYFVILNLHLKEQQTLILTYISTDILLFITEEVLSFLFKRREYDNIELKYKFLLLLVPIGSLYLCASILNTHNISLGNIISILIIFFINISIFYILNLVIKSYRQIYEQDIIRIEKEYYKNQLELIKESDKKAAKIRHDYKNHMIAVKSYINDGKLSEADKYVDKVLDGLKTPSRIVSSGNYVIDSLFNYKLANIGDSNYKLDIKIPEELFVSDYDANILFGNLLDNAINAITWTKDKKLEISIRYKYEALYIKCCNSYSGDLKKIGGVFFTTNKDKTNHGYGIKNIEEIVNKYHGNIEYHTDDKNFSVDIVLCQGNSD